MSAPATTSLAGIVKEFGLVDFPFAVGSFAQADALLDGPLGQALRPCSWPPGSPWCSWSGMC